MAPEGGAGGGDRDRLVAEREVGGHQVRVARTERDLKKLFPRSSWNKLHLQIIFFGREHCPALYHDLGTCPICSWAATRKRIAEEERSNRARRTRRKR